MARKPGCMVQVPYEVTLKLPAEAAVARRTSQCAGISTEFVRNDVGQTEERVGACKGLARKQLVTQRAKKVVDHVRMIQCEIPAVLLEEKLAPFWISHR